MSRTRNWIRVIRKEIDILREIAAREPAKWNLLMKKEEDDEIARFEEEKEIEGAD